MICFNTRVSDAHFKDVTVKLQHLKQLKNVHHSHSEFQKLFSAWETAMNSYEQLYDSVAERTILATELNKCEQILNKLIQQNLSQKPAS